jgi:hypothetical protein
MNIDKNSKFYIYWIKPYLERLEKRRRREEFLKKIGFE